MDDMRSREERTLGEERSSPEVEELPVPMRLPMLSVLRGLGLLTCGGDKLRCRNELYRCDRMEAPRSRDRELLELRLRGAGALKERGAGPGEIDGRDRLGLLDGLRLGLREGLGLRDGALGREGEMLLRRLAIRSLRLLRRELPESA
jgi:hypothetical protein